MVLQIPNYKDIFKSTNGTRFQAKIVRPFPLSKFRMKIDQPSKTMVAGLASDLNMISGQAAEDIRQGGSFESILQSQKTNAAANPASKEKWIDYTIKKDDNLWTLAVKRFHVNVEDLVKDNGIDNPDLIQPGQKIRVRIPSYPRQQEVVASWYGHEHHGKLMANGEQFDMQAATIAHKELPLGTRVELQNPETGKKVRATVTDRGPYITGRDVDLSYGLAKKLSLDKQGVGNIVMRVLG